MGDVPLWLTAASIWGYWVGVGVMVLRQRLAGRGAGVAPRQGLERWMWLVWVPVIALWNALPVLALTQDEWWWAAPAWATDGWWRWVRWVASIDVVAGLAATIACWARMGKSWAMANVPDADAELVTAGLFRWVRHPIYALSVMMMIDTFVVLPTWPMLAVAAAHVGLMHLKASSEERFLLAKHGPAYERYMRSTGRFLPRLW